LPLVPSWETAAPLDQLAARLQSGDDIDHTVRKQEPGDALTRPKIFPDLRRDDLGGRADRALPQMLNPSRNFLRRMWRRPLPRHWR